MALDRQSIEKKDFPIGRRGYEPEAVDAHLSAIAAEVEELRSSTRRRSDSVADAASEQVRAIVEAAENTANQIQREAEQEVQEIRRQARAEAQSTRDEASSQASDYLFRVSETTSALLDRLGAIEQELNSLTESLRTGATRVDADLKLLQTNLVEVKDAISPGRFEPEPEELAEPEPGPAEPSEPEATFEDAAPVPDEPPGPELETESAREPEVATAGAERPDDVEGARLIALNMALNGTPRDEVDRYLDENFDLADRATLIDEVYASVEG